MMMTKGVMGEVNGRWLSEVQVGGLRGRGGEAEIMVV